jgi:hypothetical protein
MEKVLSRSEETLDGRRLLIKDAKNFEGRPAQTKPRYQVQQIKSAPQTTVQNGATSNEDKTEKETSGQNEMKPKKPKKEKKEKKEKKVKEKRMGDKVASES